MKLLSFRKYTAAALSAVFGFFVMTAAGLCAGAAENVEVLPSQLYARCAVLMDAGTGRILFEKNGNDEAPMASTTKIMTCILALENCSPEEKVTVSRNAEEQPEVRLGMKEGDEFRLKDLLYSLMLESHNDSAVAIAEHVSVTVDDFADLMNEKAESIGCRSTYFITPNGLDADDVHGIHHTTAADLAAIMRYCIMQSPEKEAFLQITRTESWEFADISGTKKYSCSNHNAFLKMMDGALTGKTGFTADAGYCYVGALENDGRTFIVSLLACGWPYNRGYKWADTKKLMNYALENYTYQTIRPEDIQLSVYAENGADPGFPGAEGVRIPVRAEGEEVRILTGRNERLERMTDLPEKTEAPVAEGQVLGTLRYTVDGTAVAEFKLTADSMAERRTFMKCLNYTAAQALI